MGRIDLEEQYKIVSVEGEQKQIKLLTLSRQEFDKFNPDVLGLGDISSRSTQVEALAAIFDLSGFTNFCGQVDPHLAVPEYLSRFLDWLFSEIKQGLLKEGNEDT